MASPVAKSKSLWVASARSKALSKREMRASNSLRITPTWLAERLPLLLGCLGGGEGRLAAVVTEALVTMGLGLDSPSSELFSGAAAGELVAEVVGSWLSSLLIIWQGLAVVLFAWGKSP